MPLSDRRAGALVPIAFSTFNASSLSLSHLDFSARVREHTQVLDLETMQFEAGPTMERARFASAVTPLDAYRVLVIGGSHDVGGSGGFDDVTVLASTEILDATDE